MNVSAGLNEWGSLVALGLAPYRTNPQAASKSIQESVGLSMRAQHGVPRTGAIERELARTIKIQEEG